jgi:hypothetical protein
MIDGRDGEAEVGHLRLSIAVEEDVLRLEVAVDQAGVVGGGEAAAGSNELLEDVGPGARSGAQPLAERVSLQVLHGDEQAAVGGAHVVDGDDVRVGGAGQGAGLAQESLAQARGRAAAGADQLEGHGPIEVIVAGRPDHAHGPGPDLADELVAIDARARFPASHGFRDARIDREGGLHPWIAARLSPPPRRPQVVRHVHVPSQRALWRELPPPPWVPPDSAAAASIVSEVVAGRDRSAG